VREGDILTHTFMLAGSVRHFNRGDSGVLLHKCSVQKITEISSGNRIQVISIKWHMAKFVKQHTESSWQKDTAYSQNVNILNGLIHSSVLIFSAAYWKQYNMQIF